MNNDDTIMSPVKSHHTIQLMEYLSEKESTKLNELEHLCHAKDQTNLKLELGYKSYVGSIAKNNTKKINEFLYFVNDTLVAYLGISSFGGNIGELNGMTHPNWRRKGIFGQLFTLAINECQRRNFSKILLLSDGKSTSGIEFVKSIGGAYDCSEYRMLTRNPSLEGAGQITLRASEKRDRKEIARQNAIFFNDIIESADDPTEENTDSSMEENAPNAVTYLVELNEMSIGKINVEYAETSAFIYGFGILPDYRGKGYGKAALKETLRIINDKNIEEVGLDVVCTNSNALNLYKACGFEEQSIMNYYEYNINTN